MNDGMYEFEGPPPEPGGTQRALLWLLAPERNHGRFIADFEFDAWDGRVIGTGRIVRVINPSLRKT